MPFASYNIPKHPQKLIPDNATACCATMSQSICLWQKLQSGDWWVKKKDPETDILLETQLVFHPPDLSKSLTGICSSICKKVTKDKWCNLALKDVYTPLTNDISSNFISQSFSLNL